MSRLASIPSEVIKAFNEEIREKADESCKKARIYQNDVVTRIMRLMPNICRDDIFNKRWLDIEPIFVKAGWRMEFIKAAYNQPKGSYWDLTWTRASLENVCDR